MSLIITLRNITSLAPVSDYEAKVFVNRSQIAGPILVEGHARKDGWRQLVKRFAKSLPSAPADTPTRNYHRDYPQYCFTCSGDVETQRVRHPNGEMRTADVCQECHQVYYHPLEPTL